MALAALGCVGIPSLATEVNESLAFERVFSDKGQSASQHYTSKYWSEGVAHRLEVWRLGDERLKRVTDSAIEVYVQRKSGDPEFQMSVLDLKKRLITRIDRSNLYRIGNFTDWFDLAHGIKFPKGKYQLSKISKPAAGVPRALQACDWYALTQGQQTSHICWSSSSRLPMLIKTLDGQLLWQVTQVDRKPVSLKNFEIHDDGFIRNDANADIDHD